MKSSLANGKIIRWALLTMLGLAAGIIAAFLAFDGSRKEETW